EIRPPRERSTYDGSTWPSSVTARISAHRILKSQPLDLSILWAEIRAVTELGQVEPSWVERSLGGRPPPRRAVPHPVVRRKPEPPLELFDATRQRRRVFPRRAALASVGAPVAPGEMREVLLENRQVAVAHGGVETQGSRVYEPGAGLAGRPE